MTRRPSTPADPGPPAGDPPDPAYDLPVPNPPPLPTDLPPPRLITARGALVRSLLAWGWGQLATGDRRGWLLLGAQPATLAGLALVGPPLADGAGASLVFLAGSAVLFAWAGIAIHAYRRAARRRVLVELRGPDGGAILLLVFAPLAIVASTLFWGLGAHRADPATVLDRYVADWRAGRVSEAIARFRESPGTTAIVREIWDAQLAALHNELLRLLPRAGPGGGIDPDAPLDTVRWVDAGPTADGGRLVALEVSRRESVRGLVLGLLPVSRQRLVPLARLGTVELAPLGIGDPIAPDGPLPDGPWGVAWRLVEVEIMGIPLGARG